MPLTQEAEDALKHELVAVVREDDVPAMFTHYQFLAAQQEQQLARLSELVPEGSSPRRAARALQKLKTEEEHERILQRTLRRLLEAGEVVHVADRDEAQERLVAMFPVRT